MGYLIYGRIIPRGAAETNTLEEAVKIYSENSNDRSFAAYVKLRPYKKDLFRIERRQGKVLAVDLRTTDLRM